MSNALVNESIKQSIPDNKYNDQCPKDLRVIVDKWKKGDSTASQLIEASYFTQLDMLSEYRNLPLPTPPDRVKWYRGLTFDEKREWKTIDKVQLYEDHLNFHNSENIAKRKNKLSFLTLNELLEWVNRMKMSQSIIDKIKEVLNTHECQVSKTVRDTFPGSELDFN